MDFSTIIYEARDHIAKITINRPERMNGYSEPMAKEIVVAIDRALKMTLLSEVYDAKKAYELGLVTEVVPHAELEARVQDLAQRLADGPPLAIRMAKRMMYKQQEMTLQNALEDAALSVMITNPS